MVATSSHRARLLDAAHALLVEMGCEAESFVVLVRAGGAVLRFEAAGEFDPDLDHLSAQQRRVYCAVAQGDGPVNTQQIANRTGCANNSRLRGVLSELQRMELIELTRDGYQRAIAG